MPLRCCHCQEIFPVTFKSMLEAEQFQTLLQSHQHEGLAPDFDLIDQSGALAAHSSCEMVKQEEEKLNRITNLAA